MLKSLINLIDKKIYLILFAIINVIIAALIYILIEIHSYSIVFSLLFLFNACGYVMIILVFKYLTRCNSDIIKSEIEKLNNQIPHYLRLYKKISLNATAPNMRGSAISPDLANLLIDVVEKEKPKTVFECGSGVSTLIFSYMAKQNGKGHVYSLDHLEKFTNITKENLREHGLSSYANVYLSPLKKYIIKNVEYNWYYIERVDFNEEIDVLFIDGPPRGINPHYRYPALPLLNDKLSEECIVILDDADRKDEREIVEMWLKEYPEFEKNYYPTEKGTIVLKRNKN